MAARRAAHARKIGDRPLKETMKSQTAMEYLASYGWMIAILVVVLVVLYSIGILGTSTSTPRALPGACNVYRPYGPGSSSMVNLEGICSSELPRYVMESQGIGDFVFVPGSDNITSLLDVNGNYITITAWVYVSGAPYHDVVDKENQYGMKLNYNNNPHSCNPSYNTGLCLEWDTSNDWTGVSYPVPNGGLDKWAFIAVELDGNTKYWYANGQMIGSEAVSGGLSYIPSNFVIGAITPGYTGYGSAEWFNGILSNVQVYNASLSSNQLNLLYTEGLGGVPVQLQNLVGWWPLNGNANDYSGNQNNGYIYNNIFSGSVEVNNYQAP